NDLCPLLYESAYRFDIVKRSRQILVRPDIFADGHPDFFAIELERLDPTGRLEITILVENVVSRQKAFVGFANRFAVLEPGGSIMKGFSASFITINKPDQQRRFSDASM